MLKKIAFMFILFMFLSFNAIAGNKEKVLIRPSELKPMPDLVIDSVTVQPESPLPHTFFTVTIVCKNIGTGRSTTSSTMDIWHDGQLMGESVLVPLLDPGASYPFVRKNRFQQPGPHTIKVGADQKNEVLESNERNNLKSVTINVKPSTVGEMPSSPQTSGASPLIESGLKPDLTIQEISILPRHPYPDENIDIKIVVKNIGSGSTTIDWSQIDMAIKLQGPGYTNTISRNWNNEILGAFNAGTVKELHKQFKITDFGHGHLVGRFFITVLADCGHNVDETDEGNNQKDFEFLVRRRE